MVDYSRVPLDRVFQALSDPTRRAILTRLARRGATVTELAEPFPTSLNAISKHLMVLERAGLLRRRVEGREHHCTLDAAPLQTAAEWIAFYRRYWEERLAALDTLLTGRANPDSRSPHARPGKPRRRR